MSRVKWSLAPAGTALERSCPTCKALPRSPCRTPSGKHTKAPHRRRHLSRVVLSRYATTYAGTGHVRDGEIGSRAMCGTAVVLKAVPDDTHVSCPGCRGVMAHLDAHPDDPLHLRLLPLSG